MAVKKDKVTRAKLPDALPKGWQIVRFDQMAQPITDRVDNPSEAGVERYVGLEHLDPESLKIRRWGSPEDVEATKLRFKPGDIIFGKRRAYQRKLAVADFEGICSAHAMVLRAREETVLKDFLPFFMQSDIFFDRALAISVGSLSPTINWKTLASQQFAIPPKDEQRRIADILWAAEETAESMRRSIDVTSCVRSRVLEQLLGRGIGYKKLRATSLGSMSENWKVMRLRELTYSSAYGPRFSAELYITEGEGNVQTIRTTDFDRKGGIIYSSAPSAKLSNDMIEKHKLQNGDFLISRSGAYAGLSAVFNKNEGSYIPAAFVIRFRLNEHLSPYFLKYLFYSEFLNKYVLPLSRGSAQPNISGSALLDLEVPVPPIEEQKAIINVLDKVEAVSFIHENHLVNTLMIAKSLRDNLLNIRRYGD